MEMVKNPVLRVSAKLDYAVRALAELAREAPRPLKGDVLATRQAIPFRFLEVTLGELRQAGLVCSRRGSEGGYWLDRPPADITLAEISVAVEGSLVDLRAVPNGLDDGTAETVREVWDAAHRRLAEILGSVTLADLVNGALPATVRPLGAIGPAGPVGSVGSIASVEPAESAD
jgi:Rrf2 family protein